MALPVDSRAARDAERLGEIAELAWDMTGNLQGVPANARGLIAASLIRVLGKAYMEDRGKYTVGQKTGT